MTVRVLHSVHRTDVIELLLHDAVQCPQWHAAPVNGVLLYAIVKAVRGFS